jgi:serine/threonine-protein kinase
VGSLAHGRLLTGEPYIIMEYVRGIDLASYLDRAGRLPAPRALWIVRQLAAAIEYLHGLGIVHRDIKPANIMIDPEANDPVKLLDFGIARRLDQLGDDEPQGLLAGTPAYMAPEQARGEPVGLSMDDYALAAFALELLTGKPPFPHGSPMKLVAAVVNDPPRLPSELGVDVPGLDEVMAKALAKQPSDRYASVGDLMSALRRALAPQTRRAAPAGSASEEATSGSASSGIHPISLSVTALAKAIAS